MVDSLYTTSGIFLDVVDSDWVNDTLPFEDIQVNIDALPASEPELGAHVEPNKQGSREKETRVECDLLSLLLPKNPVETRFLSVRNLPDLKHLDELEVDNYTS